MITLYGMGSPNVVKVIVMLEEVGLPFEFVRINVLDRDQFTPSFRAINPNSKVPAIVDDGGSGEPVTLFESGAILLYLAEKTGILWPQDLKARAAVNQWLMFQMASFGPMSGQAIHFNYAVRDNDYGKARFTNEFDRLVNVVERRLGESAYLAGEEYSIADVALFPWIRTLRSFFADAVNQPNIINWYDRIAARPAVVRAIDYTENMGKPDLTMIRDATPEARDRYFGRVPYPKD